MDSKGTAVYFVAHLAPQQQTYKTTLCEINSIGCDKNVGCIGI
jgi:hypothetical protein